MWLGWDRRLPHLFLLPLFANPILLLLGISIRDKRRERQTAALDPPDSWQDSPLPLYLPSTCIPHSVAGQWRPSYCCSVSWILVLEQTGWKQWAWSLFGMGAGCFVPGWCWAWDVNPLPAGPFPTTTPTHVCLPPNLRQTFFFLDRGRLTLGMRAHPYSIPIVIILLLPWWTIMPTYRQTFRLT